MDTTFPNLNIKILEWRAQLERTSLNQDDQEELKIHLDDIIHELSLSNLQEDEIWILAMKRIGSISAIEGEFEKVNPDIAFRKNGMLLIYGAVMMLFLQASFILIPVFCYKNYKKSLLMESADPSINFWPELFYALAILLICSIVVLIFKGRSIIKYLSRLVLRLNMISAFVSVAVTIVSGFCLIQLLDVGAMDSTRFVASAFKTLTQIFYIGQIALIGYFLLINNKHGIRGLLSFNRKINWKIALFLGVCAGVAFTFGYTYHIAYLPLIIGCPIFITIGWMISYSRRPLINLFCSQLYVMILWCSELPGQYALIFTTFYLIILFFLVAGFSSQKLYDFFESKYS